MVEVTFARIDEQPLSDVTKKSHKTKLTYLMETFNLTLERILLNPRKVITLMKQKISEQPSTLVGYITPICTLFSIHPTFQEAHMEEYKIWSGYLTLYNKQKTKEYEEVGLKDRQIEAAITIDEVKAKFCEMAQDEKTLKDLKTNLHYVLFGMFLSIKPKRADLGDVFIVKKSKVPEAYKDKNYILLEGNDTGYLVLNDYKTSKFYGELKEKLKLEQVKVIRQSIELFPRDHLFVSTIGKNKGTPYTKANSYSQFVIRACNEHFNRKMGVSLWRHMYIAENVDFNYGNKKEINEGARLSGHSMQTQWAIYHQANQLGISKKKTKEEQMKVMTCAS
jgi:hypothetical protein